MLAVMIDGERAGSILKFPHLALPWRAYWHGDNHRGFRTKKEAVNWLTEKWRERTNAE